MDSGAAAQRGFFECPSLPRLPRIDRSAARHTLSDPAPPAPPPRGSSLPPGPPNISRPGTALLLASFQFLDALRELADFAPERSEVHTSEIQSHLTLICC